MNDEPMRQLIRRIDKITETNRKNGLDENNALVAQNVGNTIPHFADNEDVDCDIPETHNGIDVSHVEGFEG